MREGVAQRQGFERGAHFGYLSHLIEAEAGHPHAPARLTDHKTLGLQTPESLAHRHMACAEFLGNMILPKPGARLKRSGNDTVGQHFADPRGKCVFCGCHDFIDNSNMERRRATNSPVANILNCEAKSQL
ncbi:hypothetical protein GCM10011499_29080 [Pelagibacterium lentulum]|uniref:Uncharacterized protein n=1 Tax=Pelagibacterium lentulum TaxID=2029865 RepID=A0A916RI52_9HYPH|nr:hypothetical protein GCM10011499_29080 [Pelagibacterium lentulum]